MNAGKKVRQAIFHDAAGLLFASLQRLVLLAQRYPRRLFSKSRKDTKRNNIKDKGEILCR